MSDRPKMPGYDEVRAGTQTGGIPLGAIFRHDVDEKEAARVQREDRRANIVLAARVLCIALALIAVTVVAILDAPGAAAVYGIAAVVAGVGIGGLLK